MADLPLQPAVSAMRRWMAGGDAEFGGVLRASFVALVWQIVGAASTFALTVVIARSVGPAGAGAFYIGLTLALIGATIGKRGLDHAVLRFTAEHAREADHASIRDLHRYSVRRAGRWLMLVSLFMMAAAWPLSHFLFRDGSLVSTLIVMSAAILPLGFLDLGSQVLRGLEKIAQSTITSRAAVPALAILLVFFMGPSPGKAGPALAYASASLLAMMFTWLLLRRALAVPTEKSLFREESLLQSGGPLYVVAILQLVGQGASVLLLGIFLDKASVGVLGVAVRAAAVMSFLLLALNAASAPRFAVLNKSQDVPGLARLARRTSGMLALMTVPFMAVVLAAPGWVMGWFGPEFSSYGVVLVILAFGQFINSATGSVGFLLIMTGHEVAFRNSMIAAAVSGLVAAFVLIPTIGLIGAAIATATGTVMQNVVATLNVRKKLGFWPLPCFPTALREASKNDVCTSNQGKDLVRD